MFISEDNLCSFLLFKAGDEARNTKSGKLTNLDKQRVFVVTFTKLGEVYTLSGLRPRKEKL